jgi:hypothetical protein
MKFYGMTKVSTYQYMLLTKLVCSNNFHHTLIIYNL